LGSSYGAWSLKASHPLSGADQQSDPHCYRPSYRFIEDAKRIVQERGTRSRLGFVSGCGCEFPSPEQLYEYYRAMGPLYSRKFDPENSRKWNWASATSSQINYGFGGFLRTFDFVDQLQKIICPTLVNRRAHDWICPPNHSQSWPKKYAGPAEDFCR